MLPQPGASVRGRCARTVLGLRRHVVARSRGRTHRNDAGAAIIEAAIAIPALLMVALAGMWCVGLASTALSVGAAAGDAARSLARGESWDAVAERAAKAEPGASIEAQEDDGVVTVTVSRRVQAPGPILSGMALTVRRSVSAVSEWGGRSVEDSSAMPGSVAQ